MTIRLLDLWPDSRDRGTRLIEELTHFDATVEEVGGDDARPNGYFVQSIDPWMDDCLDRRYHQHAVASGANSSPFFLDVLPAAAIERLRDGAMLIVDGSIEGGAVWPLASVKALYDEVAAMGLPRACVGLATANAYMNGEEYRAGFRRAEPAARLFFHNAYFSKAVRTFAARYAGELDGLRELALARTERVGAGTRDFMCTNFLPRPHRIALISQLIADGAFDNGFVSFSDLDNVLGHKKINTTEAQVESSLKSAFDAGAGMLAGARKLRAMGRLVLDEDLVESRRLDYLIPRAAASNSWFSMVAETDMGSGSCIYITEKILKPIPFFHPIIVFGSPYSLTYLHSVGFATFAPFIDESYDAILDPKERFYRCHAEVLRLVRMDAAEKKAMIRHLWPVLEHNARHLLFTAAATIREQWSRPIIAAMMADSVAQGRH